MSKSNLDANLDIIQRKHTGLKDHINRKSLSAGQIVFLNTYMGLIMEQFDRCFDVLDEEKYREMLIQLEE